MFLGRTVIDQGLNLDNTRTSTSVIRLTQAIGRIFRSNTDHGVVVLCGGDRKVAPKSFGPGLSA